jgi:hypothetical protein
VVQGNWSVQVLSSWRSVFSGPALVGSSNICSPMMAPCVAKFLENCHPAVLFSMGSLEGYSLAPSWH